MAVLSVQENAGYASEWKDACPYALFLQEKRSPLLTIHHSFLKTPLKDGRQNRQKIVDGPLHLRGLRRDEDSYKSQQYTLAQYPIQFLLSFPSPQFARWFPLFPLPHRVRPIREYRYAIGAVSFLPRSKQWLMQTGQGYLFLGRSDRSSNQHGSCIS